MAIHVLGAGVAGLSTALRLAKAGEPPIVHEAAEDLTRSASWLAGGMLAPFCEAAVADDAIIQPGLDGISSWVRFGGARCMGTLVVAAARDGADLRQFAARARGHRTLEPDELAQLEPDLGGRFSRALFFQDEAHLDPRRTLNAMVERIHALGGEVRFSSSGEVGDRPGERVADCRGVGAATAGLRSVRGEMAIVRCRDVALSRPVRLLHPRWPIYIVPREDNLFMIGATMIEAESDAPVTLRSAVELLTAAFALHPAFAEAEVVELRSGRRPAFPDNLPRVERTANGVVFSGLYRHGFLLSPTYSRLAAEALLDRAVAA